MRFGLTLSLVFSVVLISAASWWRFGHVGEVTAPLIVSVEQVNNEEFYNTEEIFKELTTPKSTSTSATATPEPLTNTDIVTRNLLMSYIDTTVNSGGVVNPNTLKSIANQYVDESSHIHTFDSTSIVELSIVSDNEANARKYANEFSKIYANYTWEITLLTKNPKNINALATAYENMSAALKILPVPTSISLLHLELVNNQASTAAAIRSMGEAETDPVKTISGLTAIKENVLKETSALADIDRILEEKYGTL